MTARCMPSHHAGAGVDEESRLLRGILEAGTKALGAHRFTLVNVLPVTVLTLLLVGLVKVGAYSRANTIVWADVVPARLSSLPGLAGLAFVVFVLSLLLRPFQISLVRLLEGYWRGRLGAAVAQFPIEHHRRRVLVDEYDSRMSADLAAAGTQAETVVRRARRRKQLIDQRGRAGERLRYYPATGRLLPTVLGNILRSGEDRAGSRYGLDALTIYPRIYPNLSPRLDAAMSHQLDLIDTTSAVTVAMIFATLSSVPLIPIRGWDPLILIPIVAALIAAAAYEAAKAAAKGHAVLLATAIDLHRFDLIRAMHLPMPATMEEEYELNSQLSDFLTLGHAVSENQIRDIMRSGRYIHPDSPKQA